MKPLYLAGPMSGLPKFNFPAFEAATQRLRDLGLNVSSPHERDTIEVQAAAWASPDGLMDAEGKVGGTTWGDILALDVKHIADEVAGVVLLPNWHESRGARLEAFVALLCKKPLYFYAESEPLGLRCADMSLVERGILP